MDRRKTRCYIRFPGQCYAFLIYRRILNTVFALTEDVFLEKGKAGYGYRPWRQYFEVQSLIHMIDNDTAVVTVSFTAQD